VKIICEYATTPYIYINKTVQMLQKELINANYFDKMAENADKILKSLMRGAIGRVAEKTKKSVSLVEKVSAGRVFNEAVLLALNEERAKAEEKLQSMISSGIDVKKFTHTVAN